MKVLITGASSLPGFRITKSMLASGNQVLAMYNSHEIPSDSKDFTKMQMDVTDYVSLEKTVREFKPDVIVHAAAFGDVDGCEKDKTSAWKINVEGTKAIAKIAKNLSSFLIYLSTDYVFDGQRGGYAENDIPSPINYYGLTKLCGEIAVSALDRFAIVRASTIYGFGPGRANFAKVLFDKLSKSEKIKAVDDQYTSPTQASLLGEAVAEIAERKLTGVFHVAGPRLSRYEFAVRVADSLGLDKSLIERASMKEMSWLAARPKDSSLKCEMTKQILKVDFNSIGRATQVLVDELRFKT